MEIVLVSIVYRTRRRRTQRILRILRLAILRADKRVHVVKRRVARSSKFCKFESRGCRVWAFLGYSLGYRRRWDKERTGKYVTEREKDQNEKNYKERQHAPNQHEHPNLPSGFNHPDQQFSPISSVSLLRILATPRWKITALRRSPGIRSRVQKANASSFHRQSLSVEESLPELRLAQSASYCSIRESEDSEVKGPDRARM